MAATAPFGEIASAVKAWPGPAWLTESRLSAIDRFDRKGLPTTRQEGWRTTPLPNLGSEPLALGIRTTPQASSFVGAFAAADVLSVVFVDGLHAPALSSPESAWPKGLRIAPISRVLDKSPDELRPWSSVDPTGSALRDLNAAAFRDGAFIQVEDGVSIPTEVRIVVVANQSAQPTAQHLRHVIQVGRGSSLRLLIAVVGEPNAAGFTNQHTTLSTGERSKLDLVRIHESPQGVPHFDTVDASIGAHAVVNDTLLQTGAGWTRSEIDVALEGEGGSVDLGGVFVARGAQVSGIHTLVSHRGRSVVSRQNYRGLAADEGRGAFHGQIKVEATARGADATQSNKNMLLSKRAQIHSTPALEILTDDVKCKHGSATGQIDQAHLFYLRSRGIDLQDATRMLTRAFAGEILSRIDSPSTRALVEAQIAPSLEALGVAG